VGIAFVGFTAVGGGASEPAGVLPGDVLLALAEAGATTPPTGPTGWAQVGSSLSANTNAGNIWSITRGASAPSYTWGGVSAGGVNVYAFRGASGTLDASATGTAGSSTVPSVTATSDSDWLVCFYGDNSSTNLLAPTGMTEPGSPQSFGAAAYQALGAAGPTGTKVFTGTIVAPIGAWSVALISLPDPPAYKPLITRNIQLGSMAQRNAHHFVQQELLPPVLPVPPMVLQQTALPRTRPLRSLTARSVNTVQPVQVQAPSVVPQSRTSLPHSLPGLRPRLRNAPGPSDDTLQQIPPTGSVNTRTRRAFRLNLRQVTPVRAQQNPVDVLQVVGTRARRIFRPSTRQVTPVPAQQNPVDVIQPVGSRQRRIFRPRPGTPTPVPPQFNPVDVLQGVRSRTRQVFRPRVRQQAPQPPQVTPPPPYGPAPVRVRRFAALTRRAVTPTATPAQVLPVRPVTTRQRRIFRPRPVTPTATPPQFNPIISVQAVRTRARMIFRPRPGTPTATPAQVYIPPPYVLQATKIRRWLTPARRGVSEQVTPAQQNPVNVPDRHASRPRTVAFRLRRPVGTVTPAQVYPPPPYVPPTPVVRRFGTLKRGRTAFPAPGQDSPNIRTMPTRTRPLPSRKERQNWYVPPTNAPIPVTMNRHRLRAFLLRRGASRQVVPAQLNPPYPVQAVTSRARRIFRPTLRQVLPVPPQAAMPYTLRTVTSRIRTLLRTRSRTAPAVPVQEQVQPVRPAHPTAALRRVRAAAGPPVQQQAPPARTQARRTALGLPARLRTRTPAGGSKPPPFVAQKARQAWQFLSRVRYGSGTFPVQGGLPPFIGDVRIVSTEAPPGWSVREEPVTSWQTANATKGSDGVTIRQSSLSTEYVRYQVQATLNGLPYSPVQDTVQFAFLPIGQEPILTDWVTGSWETVTQYGMPQYNARCLVGPNGAAVLPKGQYVVWLRIADTPEVPVRNVGNLLIT
jgi:hypothetical protein